MELLDSSSDEEDSQADFWNNWLPSTSSAICQSKSKTASSFRRSRGNVFPPSRKSSFNCFADDPKFGNWIPPDQLLSRSLKIPESTVIKKYPKQSQNETLFCESFDNSETKQTSEVRKTLSVTTWRKELNLSWGNRVQLHDVSRYSDGDLTWGIINLGVFANIRLWVNECGNICSSADGKITKLGSSEETLIFIKNNQLLRKMLGLSSAQWSSLCETVQETKTDLKFDAFEPFEVTTKSSLEKLWFFICKRRHFLPNQCMLVKLCGAVKCLRKFKVTTKLIVQDIRNVLGEPIL